MEGLSVDQARALATMVVDADFEPRSQDVGEARRHAMCSGGFTGNCTQRFQDYVNEQFNSGTAIGLARAIHGQQDLYSRGHGLDKIYTGFFGLPISHPTYDSFISAREFNQLKQVTGNMIRRFRGEFPGVLESLGSR